MQVEKKKKKRVFKVKLIKVLCFTKGSTTRLVKITQYIATSNPTSHSFEYKVCMGKIKYKLLHTVVLLDLTMLP